ncbi:MAG: hypothetical protein K2H04_07140 [Bacteroidaceae bacterium]|nr:hypothetical protein [Bacteroidaceae bacterium]
MIIFYLQIVAAEMASARCVSVGVCNGIHLAPQNRSRGHRSVDVPDVGSPMSPTPILSC